MAGSALFHLDEKSRSLDDESTTTFILKSCI
jgi:hypothetical protein